MKDRSEIPAFISPQVDKDMNINMYRQIVSVHLIEQEWTLRTPPFYDTAY